MIRTVIDKLKSINNSVNLANKLTILRILLVPIFVVFLMVDKIPHNLVLSLLVFAAASITDFLDGYIARTRMMITEMGKFLDLQDAMASKETVKVHEILTSSV